MILIQKKLLKLNFKWLSSRNFGLKRRFGITGILVAVITNIVLFSSLTFLNPLISTLLSQICNASIGFLLYSKNVFFKEISLKRFFTKYLICSIVVWNTNFFIIKLFNYSFNIYFAAFLAIPIVASISFVIQKYFVFK